MGNDAIREDRDVVESREDRKEFLEQRKIFIDGEKNASDKLNQILVLLSTWWFIYTKESVERGSQSTCFLILAWFFFLIWLLSVIWVYYFSWKAHWLRLDNFDYEYENDRKNKKSENRADRFNDYIEFLENLSAFSLVFGAILLFISYVF